MLNEKCRGRQRVILAAAIMGIIGSGTRAGSILVTSFADSGPGTLRDAITQANAAGGTSDIEILGPNLGSPPATITILSPMPVISFAGDIQNIGTGSTTVSGGNLYRPFFIDDAAGSSFTISNMTVANGMAKGGDGGAGGGGAGMGAGGAIFLNSGNLTLNHVSFTNNSAVGGTGGTYILNNGGGGGGGLGGNGGYQGSGGGLYGNGQTYNGGAGGEYFDGGHYGGIDTGGGGGGSLSAGGNGSDIAANAQGGTGGAGGGGKGGANANDPSSNGQNGSTGGGGGGAGLGPAVGGVYDFSANGGNGGRFGGGGAASGNGIPGNGGDFGGGGSYGSNSNYPVQSGAGNGGFGGGGGGGIFFSGIGGFGGGGGAALFNGTTGTPGGAFGGTSGYAGSAGNGGGGGAALGGTIFVRAANGASLTLSDSTLDAGSLTPGAAGQQAPNNQVNLPAGQTAGSSLFLLGGTTTIAVNSGTQTIPGTIADASAYGTAGALAKTGQGYLVLTGANTYAGGTTISSGVLQIGNGSNTGSIAGDIVDNSGLAFDRSDGFTFSGAISGVGVMAQEGGGTLILTHANTNTGGTNIISGTIEALNVPLAGGPISLTAGTSLQYVTDANSVTQPGATFSGNGTILKAGTGTLIFGGGGMVTVNLSAGSLFDIEVGTFVTSSNVQASWSFNQASLKIAAGATVDAVEGGPSYSQQFNALSGAGALRGGYFGNPGGLTTLTLGSGGGSGTFSGTISDDPSAHLAITKTGTGTQILSGTSTYTGGTTISAGALQIGSGGTTGSIAGDILDNALLIFNRSDTPTFAGTISGVGSVTTSKGTLVLTGSNTYSGSTTISAGTLQLGNGAAAGSVVGNILDNATLAFDRSDSYTFPGIVSGTGALRQIGAGTLILTASNSYTGGTTITAGTLQIGNNGTTGTIAGNITDNATLIFSRSNTNTFAGNITGTGAVTKNATATLILTGTDSYSGLTTITAGLLQIGNGGTIGSITGNVLDNASLVFSRSDSTTFAGNITGTGSLTKNGASTLILTGANSLTGGTTLSAGVLQIGNGAAIGSLAGNVLDNASLIFNRSDTLTVPGAISGTGSLLQQGAGTLILTHANTYTGNTTIQTGTLDVLGVNLPGGNISVAAGSILQYDTSTANVIQPGATLTGTGTLQKNGTGLLAFGSIGAVNINLSAGSLIDIQAGTINGSAAYQGNWTANQASLNIAAGAIFDAVEGGPSDSQQFNALTGAGSLRGGFSGNPAGLTTLTLGVANSSGTFSGIISDDSSAHLAIIKTGTGTQIFTGANTYTGGTTITAGILQIGNGGTTGSLVGNVADNAQLTFNRSNSSTFAGAISGTGALTKNGTGTLVLTGTSNYTGTTTVAAGTLQIGSGGTAGSITGDITDNAVLAFDRTDNFTMPGNITGTGNITQSGTGTVTLNNLRTTAATLSHGTLKIAANGSSAGLSTLTSLTLAGTFAAPTARLDLTDNDLILPTASISPDNLRLLILAGYNNGAWTGNGIVASAAITTPGAALGYGTASSLGLTSLDGQTLAPSAVIVEFASAGDLNLDGTINADDFALMDRSFAKGGLPNAATWVDGDLDYSGTVTSADYLLIDRAFALQSGPLSPAFLAERESQFGPAYVSELITSIPEPAAISLLATASIALLPRRRRKARLI